MGGKILGEITTLTPATSKKESLRTTVPMSIVKQFDLEKGDKLDWMLKAENGDIIIIAKPIKSSSERFVALKKLKG